MPKLLYVLLAVAFLLPGVLAAGVSVYGYVRTKAAAAALSSFSEPGMVFITHGPSDLRMGPLRFSFQPRPWAALLVLAGAALWAVGILCLFFLPQR